MTFQFETISTHAFVKHELMREPFSMALFEDKHHSGLMPFKLLTYQYRFLFNTKLHQDNNMRFYCCKVKFNGTEICVSAFLRSAPCKMFYLPIPNTFFFCLIQSLAHHHTWCDNQKVIDSKNGFV